MIFSVISMFALLAFASLAVDWGYVQCTKSEMQRQADATARGYLAYYAIYGQTTANASGPSLYSPASGWNPVDGNSGVAPTVAVTWGYWNTATSQFVAGTNASYSLAVQCVVSRKASGSNALSMPFARYIGWAKTDVTCTAVAVQIQSTQSGVANPPATSDIWLAGMPNGSTASTNDTTTNATPYLANSIPVVPGTYLEFSGITGFASNSPTVASSAPDGDTNWVLAHDAGAENGIVDLNAPIHALIGVFLDASAPSGTAAPAGRDYSTSASRDQSAYDDIRLKQPFFIGDGQTAAGVNQRFMVPAGATRLYLGSMDGFEWNNNWGQYFATVTVDATISLKK